MRPSEVEIAEIDAELRQIDEAIAEADLDDEGDPRFAELAERKAHLERRRERLAEAVVRWA
jgi:hypothetical protein